MKRKPTKKAILLWAALTLLTASAILITYSLTMIIGSKIRAEQRLKEWDDLIDQPSSEVSEAVSISDPVSDPGSAESVSPSSAVTAPPSPTPVPTTVKKAPLLGVLTFYSLNNKRVAVVEGISKADLRGAAGHAPYSAKPGRPGNCIIFGHRDGVFIGFKDLKIGDTFQIKTTTDAFTYRIVSMTVVPPEDPLISKRYFTPTMTLVTCYPFRYVGHAPNRYVVVSELVSEKDSSGG